MALIGNYSLINKSPGKFRAGTVDCDRAQYVKPGAFRNLYAGEASVAKFNSVPSGGTAWIIAQTSGGLAAFTSLTAATTNTGQLNSGINLVGSITGSITTTQANLAQIINMLVDLSASISNTALLAAVAGLQASFSATGTITDAQLGAIISMIANLTASGSFTNANDFATANISASITSVTELSPQSLAAAVWASLVDGSYSAEEVMALLASVAAGKTSITDLGGGNATVVFRDLDDTKDRITASMTGSERTLLTLDGT